MGSRGGSMGSRRGSMGSRGGSMGCRGGSRGECRGIAESYEIVGNGCTNKVDEMSKGKCKWGKSARGCPGRERWVLQGMLGAVQVRDNGGGGRRLCDGMSVGEDRNGILPLGLEELHGTAAV